MAAAPELQLSLVIAKFEGLVRYFGYVSMPAKRDVSVPTR